MAALSAEVIAAYRDERLASMTNRDKPTRNNTVRLELALLGHLYTVSIQERGLTFNPVLNIRKPSPGDGPTRRLEEGEEVRLLSAVHAHSNPMLARTVVIALEAGMRSSGITSLWCSQVDIRRRVVRLIDTKNDDSRTVPLSKKATKAFIAALANPVQPAESDLVFFWRAWFGWPSSS